MPIYIQQYWIFSNRYLNLGHSIWLCSGFNAVKNAKSEHQQIRSPTSIKEDNTFNWKPIKGNPNKSKRKGIPSKFSHLIIISLISCIKSLNPPYLRQVKRECSNFIFWLLQYIKKIGSTYRILRWMWGTRSIGRLWFVVIPIFQSKDADFSLAYANEMSMKLMSSAIYYVHVVFFVRINNFL